MYQIFPPAASTHDIIITINTASIHLTKPEWPTHPSKKHFKNFPTTSNIKMRCRNFLPIAYMYKKFKKEE
jgi:hypothetical protein